MPRLLDLMAAHSVRGTFFTTAAVARRHPCIVQRLVEEGHELASHGVTHRAFDTLSPAEAEREIAESVAVLRDFAPVDAFRAPYLRFPLQFVPMLVDHGIGVDCSGARYKTRGGGMRDEGCGNGGPAAGTRDEGCGNGGPAAGTRGGGARADGAASLALEELPPPSPTEPPHAAPARTAGSPLRFIDASLTSSVLRMPDAIRWPYMWMMGWPLVLFVHPWEFVDLRRTKVRWDCRFRTGERALACVGDVFRRVRARGGEFVTVREHVAATPEA